jgi:hypothetical protein
MIDPKKKEQIKAKLMRIAVIINDDDEYIRFLDELEKELVGNIKTVDNKGVRDYSRLRLVLIKNNLPLNFDELNG